MHLQYLQHIALGVLLLQLMGVEKVGAQEATDTLKWGAKLPTLQVEALRPREVIPPQALSGTELERMSSHSVADAVRFFSGVQLKDYGGLGGLKTIDVRSMGSNHMGVFYNGIQLGNAQNGQIDLGKFSLDNVESIALYNGQKSNLFQSARDFGSAGTLYITTRRPKFARGEHTHLRGTLKVGSFGQVAPSFLYEQKLTEWLNLSLSGEYIQSKGNYPFRYKRLFHDGTIAYDTTAYRHNSDLRAARAEASLYGKLPQGGWNLHGYFYTSERGLPGPVVRNVFSHGQRLHDTNIFVQSKAELEWNKQLATKVNAKYANDYTRYIDKEWSSPLYVDNRYEQHELYLSLAHRYKATPWWQVALATDFQYNALFANLPSFAYPSRFTAFVALASELNWRGLTLQGSLLTTLVREKVKEGHTPEPQNRLSPAVILAYQPWGGHDFVVRAFWKRSFRMPTFNDLYYTLVGNSYLTPEHVEQLSVGMHYGRRAARGLWRELLVDASLYHNRVKDKIVAVPAGNMFRWMMLNLGKVQILGSELSAGVAVAPLPHLTTTLRATYTYQRALDVTHPSHKNYRHQVVYIPRHSGSLLLGAEYKGWGLNYSFIYTGTRYNAKYNSAESRMLPWYTSDLSAQKQFTLGKGKYKLRTSLHLNNLLNQHYDVVLNYPMPGFNWHLTTQFEWSL